MNKIFILEGKQGEVLSILTTKEDMTYKEFTDICTEASQDTDSDFYTIKDRLINEYNFVIVDCLGGFTCNKKKGFM